jgi:parallel beta-helix repeat protein
MHKLAGIFNIFKIAIIFCFLLTENPIVGQTISTVVINEILATNHSSVLDPDYNQYSDWIELYNSGTSSIDLGGSYLSDNPDDPLKWKIPTGTMIPADDRILIWADGMDTAHEGLHTNFKLNNNGETITLVTADGTVIDQVASDTQITDVSFGRKLNSPSEWLYYEQPTPGLSNSTTGIVSNKQSGYVQISPSAGFYHAAQSASVSAASGSDIRYTTDGSTPTATSREYSAPISISSTTVLKARTFAPNLLPGPVETCTFFIGEETHLPVFSLSTDPENLWDNDTGIYVDENIEDRKEWERPATIEFFEVDGRLSFIRNTDMRLFGRTAIYLPQKSLSFFMSNTLDYPLFKDIDLEEFDSFVLRSSSDDWHLTMFRDGFVQKVIRRNMSVGTQSYRPAVLFINGEYWGIHNIREKYNESYLATHYGADPKNVDLLYIDERNSGGVEVLAGDRQHYDAMIAFVENNNLALQENYNQLSQMVDIDNLMDYVIAEAFMGNVSWAHNIRSWRPHTADGKWQWLVFDQDRSYRDLSFNSLAEMSDRLPVFKALLDNQAFKERFLLRFVEYINDAFNPQRVTLLLDSLQAAIAPEMQNHSDRWRGICGNGVCGIASLVDWQDDVSVMRSIVEQRPAVVRQQLRDLFQLNNTVNLQLQVLQPGYGEVALGELTRITNDYSGDFFQNMTVKLTAIPYDGYKFSGWRESAATVSVLVERGSTWKYYDHGSSPGALWNTLNFDDTAWSSGAAQLGYGDGDETTLIDYGSNANNKYITTYFRLSFNITDASSVQNLVFSLLRDDGAVVYLNGQEVIRSNMPNGAVSYNTNASSSVGGGDENTFFEYSVDGNALINGENILAVEIHQSDNASSDISFDLEMAGVIFDGADGSLISENPIYNLQIGSNLVLTALFTVNAANQLPAQILANTILTAVNSPYIALTDVTIHPNVILTIEPGVDIQLAFAKNLVINGELHVNGSADLPVVFRGIGPNHWGAFCIEDATGSSSMTHTRISSATAGTVAVHFKAAISSWNSDVMLDHVQMENVIQPFYGNGGNFVLTNCTLDGTGTGDDILNIQYASARIENCYLFGNGELDFDAVDNGIIRNNRIDIISTNSNRDGIDIGSSDNVLIENNRVFDCPDKGISIGEKSSGTIVRGNLVVNTGMGVAVKDDSYAEVDHNTFYNDTIGVSCYEKVAGQGGGNAKVTNTIFAGSYTSEFSTDDKSSIEISFSLSEKNLLSGTGNIKNDPKFVAVFSHNFNLRADSPCISAGDPNSPLDPDSTRTDMGAFYYNTKANGGTGLYINELMADNITTLAEKDGEFSDWIEIYNAGQSAVDIGGMFLTDDFNTPKMWQIPENKTDSTTIKPGQYLILWADKAMNKGVLHVDLKLSAAGEQLALIKIDNKQIVIVDSVSFSLQKPDVSWGRDYDSAPDWRFFNLPTPGSTNDPLYNHDSSDSELIPTRFMVHQNYPNPFNPATTIFFELSSASHVTVEIYNLLGQRVAKLVQEQKQAGVYKIIWNAVGDTGNQLPSGIYFLRVTAGAMTATRKMMLIR